MSGSDPETKVSVVVAGAAGRMGRRLVALADEMPEIDLVGAFERDGHEAIGTDSGQLAGGMPNGLPITGGPQTKAQVLIDFTVPSVTRRLLELCAREDMAMVIGTTGLDGEDHATIDEAARSVPIVQAPNMSLGINLLTALVRQAARQLGDGYDIEVLEAHHRFKKDAPSGTALALAEAICEATGKDPQRDLVYERRGKDATRRQGQITMQTLRLGDVVGEHTVFFGGLGERLELRHVATSRDTFAHGALRAARWLLDRPPGRYAMQDVLGLGA